MLVRFRLCFPVWIAFAASTTLAATSACSGRTGREDAEGGEGPSVDAAGGSSGASGSPLTPGGAGGVAAGSASGGNLSSSGSAQMPLMGAAFFDFDCSSNGSLPDGDQCAICEKTQCKEELKTALGQEWDSGDADGPCKGWFDCVQECECNDQPCYRACSGKLNEGTCPDGFAPLDSCLSSTCASSCSNHSG
jgi:hypothetical protein